MHMQFFKSYAKIWLTNKKSTSLLVLPKWEHKTLWQTKKMKEIPKQKGMHKANMLSRKDCDKPHK